MKKLFLSAFAMSLIVFAPAICAQTEAIDDFLGLETELLPDLKGSQRFTTPNYHQQEEWRVSEEKVIQDRSVPNKGQRYSIIPWSTLNTEEWLSIDSWLIQREVKDATPDWKIRLRHSEHKELLGKVLQCKGECEVYRGINKSTAQHLTNIQEGDEFKTGKDSVAWIYMMDGSLLRISPDSCVSLQEINVSSKEIFFLIRLNQGHVFWHSRSKNEFMPDFSPETDSWSLPLLVRESNQQYFERSIYKKQNDEEKLNEIIHLEENAVLDQFKSLNALRSENDKVLSFVTNLMFVTPTGSITSSNNSFDALYVPGGETFFKKREHSKDNKFSLGLRGYLSENDKEIQENAWYKVESNGRSFSQLEDVPGTFQVLELLTKRIKTIELAREIWVRDFTLPLIHLLSNPEKMAHQFGYTVWNENLSERIKFLSEYTRRVETTNLKSIQNLITRMEESGKKISVDISEEHYRKSLNHYLLSLKSRYDNKKMRVREMNDVQYYVWILRNGKF
jgi:hypothetical protein